MSSTYLSGPTSQLELAFYSLLDAESEPYDSTFANEKWMNGLTSERRMKHMDNKLQADLHELCQEGRLLISIGRDGWQGPIQAHLTRQACSMFSEQASG